MILGINPVRAGLVEQPDRWPWSSAGRHSLGRHDPVVADSPLADLVTDWTRFLEQGLSNDIADDIRWAQKTGRPMGGEAFLDHIESTLDRPVRPKRREG